MCSTKVWFQDYNLKKEGLQEGNRVDFEQGNLCLQNLQEPLCILEGNNFTDYSIKICAKNLLVQNYLG